jgi:hypothetical protein
VYAKDEYRVRGVQNRISFAVPTAELRSARQVRASFCSAQDRLCHYVSRIAYLVLGEVRICFHLQDLLGVAFTMAGDE